MVIFGFDGFCAIVSTLFPLQYIKHAIFAPCIYDEWYIAGYNDPDGIVFHYNEKWKRPMSFPVYSTCPGSNLLHSLAEKQWTLLRDRPQITFEKRWGSERKN